MYLQKSFMDYGRKKSELPIQYQVRLVAISVLKSWPEPEDGIRIRSQGGIMPSAKTSRPLRLAAAVIVFAATACGQEGKARRLETVTWSPTEHKLTWVVASGDMDEGKFKSKGKLSYVIDLDKATMQFNGENRGFSKNEAANVHALMDLVAKYAVESTVWWDDGQGDKLDKKPDRNNTVRHDKAPVKPQSKPSPEIRLASSRSIAAKH